MAMMSNHCNHSIHSQDRQLYPRGPVNHNHKIFHEMILIIFIFIGILNVSNAFEYTDAALADQITSLPGLSDTLDFNHFSGYRELNSRFTVIIFNIYIYSYS